jgi:IS1 family transposase
LIYAYHRATGEIVSFVWGKRDLKTAGKLQKKLSDSRVNYGSIATDNWVLFLYSKVKTILSGRNLYLE